MQGTYSPYAPYPSQYYAPTAPYPNGGGREPAVNIYTDWPTVPQGQPPGHSSMPRPRQERNVRPPNGTPMPRPQQLSTRYNPQLKSAMKRPDRSVSDPVHGQLQRTRTNSDPRHTLNPMTRTRTSSNVGKDIPGTLRFLI